MASQIFSFHLKSSPEAKQYQCTQHFDQNVVIEILYSPLTSEYRMEKNKAQTKNKPFALQTNLPRNAFLKSNNNKNRKGGRRRFSFKIAA